MDRSIKPLYLDLLKKSLCFLLWPEPPTPLDTFNYARPPLRRIPITLASKLLAPLDLQLVKRSKASDTDR
jgi:hypothetical protein